MDLSGYRFDGDQDGLPGGVFIHEFNVASAHRRPVYEGLDNDTKEKADTACDGSRYCANRMDAQ